MSQFVGVVANWPTHEELIRSEPLDDYHDAFQWACKCSLRFGEVVIRVVVVK